MREEEREGEERERRDTERDTQREINLSPGVHRYLKAMHLGF